MGRELRRKQAKKEGKSLQKEEIKEKNQIKSLIKITLTLVCLGCIFYITSALLITKELDWFQKEENTPTNSVENTILASSIFKQTEEEYYVYFYDFTDEENNVDITDTVNNKLSEEKVYKVDTSSALNSNYVTDKDSNKSATTLEDLKVITPTLIKIENDKIVKYYESKEITDNLD